MPLAVERHSGHYSVNSTQRSLWYPFAVTAAVIVCLHTGPMWPTMKKAFCKVEATTITDGYPAGTIEADIPRGPLSQGHGRIIGGVSSPWRGMLVESKWSPYNGRMLVADDTLAAVLPGKASAKECKVQNEGTGLLARASECEMTAHCAGLPFESATTTSGGTLSNAVQNCSSQSYLRLSFKGVQSIPSKKTSEILSADEVVCEGRNFSSLNNVSLDCNVHNMKGRWNNTWIPKKIGTVSGTLSVSVTAEKLSSTHMKIKMNYSPLSLRFDSSPKTMEVNESEPWPTMIVAVFVGGFLVHRIYLSGHLHKPRIIALMFVTDIVIPLLHTILFCLAVTKVVWLPDLMRGLGLNARVVLVAVKGPFILTIIEHLCEKGLRMKRSTLMDYERCQWYACTAGFLFSTLVAATSWLADPSCAIDGVMAVLEFFGFVLCCTLV